MLAPYAEPDEARRNAPKDREKLEKPERQRDLLKHRPADDERR